MQQYKQYKADPRLLDWIFRNTDRFPQTYWDLKKIKKLDSKNRRYDLRNDFYDAVLPSWLAEEDDTFSLIGEMENLQYLRMGEVRVDDFSFLAKCKKLKKLYVEDTNFSDCSLLLHLPALKEVSLPERKKLQHIEVLEQLKKQISIQTQEPYDTDDMQFDMKIVNSNEIVCAFEGASDVRFADVSLTGQAYTLWHTFSQGEENNWYSLEKETKQSMMAQLEDAIIKEKVGALLFSLEPWGEDHFLMVEFEKGWAAVVYIDLEAGIYAMPYNPEYDTLTILAPVLIGGQTPVPRMWALYDMELVAKIVRYFVEHGQLYPDIQWALQV